VKARLEGVGSLKKDKQVLFINIGDHVEEIEVQLLPGGRDHLEFLITFHGDTYRVRIHRTLPKEQEYTPVLLEVNGQTEEFLIKHP
jgi:hypothetical protein